MWRRLPTWFPNIKLTMLPISEAELQQVLECGWLREVAFKTEPRVNKFEIKAFLESVHGMQVERVSTINYQGKKQRIIDDKGRPHYRRLSDWKKAYVIFKPPPEKLEQWQQQKQRQSELIELAGKQQRLQESNREPKQSLRKLPKEQRQEQLQQRQQQQSQEDKELLSLSFNRQERVILRQQEMHRQLDGWQQQVQQARKGVLEPTAQQQKQRRPRQQQQQQQQVPQQQGQEQQQLES